MPAVEGGAWSLEGLSSEGGSLKRGHLHLPLTGEGRLPPTSKLLPGSSPHCPTSARMLPAPSMTPELALGLLQRPGHHQVPRSRLSSLEASKEMSGYSADLKPHILSYSPRDL